MTFTVESLPDRDGEPDWNGYPIDECYESDQQAIVDNDTPMTFSAADIDPSTVPDVNDPRDWHQTEHQGQVGSCHGHAVSSVVECAYRVATDGKVEQFSRQMGYIGSQMADGIYGDKGATLSGGMRLVKEKGLCLEKTCPYPGRYVRHIPDAAWEEARKYIIRSSTWLSSYQDVVAYLYSGTGGVEIGCKWSPECANSRGLIEDYNPGSRDGGHAISFLGWSRRKDRRGQRWLYLVNSHGTQWGDRGVAEVSPRVVDLMLQQRQTSCMGLSDLNTPTVRRIDFLKRPVLA